MSLTPSPTSDEPQAEAVMEGRDQGEAGASRVCVCARVCLSLLTTAGCLLSEAGPAKPHVGVLTTLPSCQGPSPCFLSPGLPGLLALTVPEPLGGWWGGTVAQPASPTSHPMLLSPVGISGAV